MPAVSQARGRGHPREATSLQSLLHKDRRHTPTGNLVYRLLQMLAECQIMDVHREAVNIEQAKAMVFKF